MSKTSELRGKDVAALEKEVSDLLKAHVGLRMQKATQQLTNHTQLGNTRREIARVKTIIAQHLEIPPQDVKNTASFIDDLGADSLAIVELVLAFEEEFELDIPDEETERIRTVQDAVDYIAANVKGGRPTATA